MPEILIKKSGQYALGGLRVMSLKAGDVMLVSQSEYDDIVKTSWAEPYSGSAKEPAKPDPEPVKKPEAAKVEPAEEPATSDAFSLEFAEMLADDGDKKALEEYARPFGFELDRRKSIENMLIDLRAAAAGK
jgi:hypothetical protein